MTVAGANGGSGCTFEIIKPRGRIDQFGLVLRDRGTGYSTGDLITVFRETYNSVAPDATFTATQTTNPGQIKMEAPKSGKNTQKGLGGLLSILGCLASDLSDALVPRVYELLFSGLLRSCACIVSPKADRTCTPLENAAPMPPPLGNISR